MENEKKESKYSSSVWLFAVCWMVYACGYVGRVNYSTAVESMQTSGIVNASLAGTVSAVYFVCYAVGQLINGVLADKKPPFLLVLIGTVLIALLPSPSFLLAVWWGINGFGQSMLWAPVFFILSNVLNPRLRVKAITIISLTTPIGKIAGYLLSGLSLNLGGWKGVFEMAAAVLALVSLLWVSVWLFAHKDFVVEQTPKTQKTEKSKKQAGLGALLVKSGVIIALPALLIHGLFLNGAAEWIPTILQTSYSVSEETASYLSTIIPAVGVLGVFLCNWAITKLCKKDEMKGGLLFMGGCIVPVAVLLLLTLNIGSVGIGWEAVIFVALYGILYVFQLAYNHIMISLVPLNFTMFALGATVSGLSNAVNYGGSAISTYAMSVAIENMQIWQLMLVWLGVLAVASLFMLLACPKWKTFKAECELLKNPVVSTNRSCEQAEDSAAQPTDERTQHE